jgi:hypothetical protein
LKQSLNILSVQTTFKENLQIRGIAFTPGIAKTLDSSSFYLNLKKK